MVITMSILPVEDAIGWSATLFNRVYATSSTEFQVQINATTRIVIRGSFGAPNQPPYTGTYDAPQVGSISSFEIWHTSNSTSAAAILGTVSVTGPMDRLETLFEELIMPADAVRSAIPRNPVVPGQIVAVDAGTSTYFDIRQTDGTYLRFLGQNLAYDASGIPILDQGSISSVIELDANKQDYGTGVHNFSSAGLGIISVLPLHIYMALFDEVLVDAFYGAMFDNAELRASYAGNLNQLDFPFLNYFLDATQAGTAGRDLMNGYFGIDTFDGKAGHDQLNGRADNDVLKGGAGNDTIRGGSGADKITGGTGKDALYGGTGADQFLFLAANESGPNAATQDVIFGFNHAQGDKINLRAIDAVPGGADQAFKLDTGNGFVAGEYRIVAVGADRVLQLNLNSNPTAEMSILLKAPVGFVAADLLL